MNLVSLESLLIYLLDDNAQISIFSKVDIMYVLYWVTYSCEKCMKYQNSIKQRNLDSYFANISKAISSTSDSFPLDEVTRVL